MVTVNLPIDGRTLAGLRTALGVEQRELAARIGCRCDDLSRAERFALPGGVYDRAVAALHAIAAERGETRS